MVQIQKRHLNGKTTRRLIFSTVPPITETRLGEPEIVLPVKQMAKIRRMERRRSENKEKMRNPKYVSKAIATETKSDKKSRLMRRLAKLEEWRTNFTRRRIKKEEPYVASEKPILITDPHALKTLHAELKSLRRLAKREVHRLVQLCNSVGYNHFFGRLQREELLELYSNAASLAARNTTANDAKIIQGGFDRVAHFYGTMISFLDSNHPIRRFVPNPHKKVRKWVEKRRHCNKRDEELKAIIEKEENARRLAFGLLPQAAIDALRSIGSPKEEISS